VLWDNTLLATNGHDITIDHESPAENKTTEYKHKRCHRVRVRMKCTQYTGTFEL
jgi:hypothetical protein